MPRARLATDIHDPPCTNMRVSAQRVKPLLAESLGLVFGALTRLGAGSRTGAILLLQLGQDSVRNPTRRLPAFLFRY
jgi:hypothetical protein